MADDTKPGVTDSAYKFASTFGLGRILQSQRNTPVLKSGLRLQNSGLYEPLDSGVVQNGTISLANSALSLSGANAILCSDAGFAYTSTDSSITLYWDGTNGSTVIVQRRSDRTRQTIPPGSITVTGLTASTTYYVLPFWVPSNQCTIGFVPGTAGTPAILFTSTANRDAIQKQNYQEREPLSSTYMTVITAAGGGSGGGGAGGGGCPMLGTAIEGLDGADIETTHCKWHDWWCLETSAGGVNVVPEHPFFDQNGFRKQAKEFCIGDYVTHRTGLLQVTDSYGFLRACTKVVVRVPKHGLYWANGYLSHNQKVPD